MFSRYGRKAVVVLVVCAFVFGGLAGCKGDSGGLAVPDRYKSIQEAIDAAKDGQTVVVSPGTYNERIDFKGKAITVRSTKPEDLTTVEETIIDGGMEGPTVSFTSKETAKAVLSGLTIRGGTTGRDAGGGILILNSSPTISRCLVTGNSARRVAAGISIGGDSAPEIINNIITENEGVPIWSGSGAHPKITDNTITHNQSAEFAVNGSITVSRGKATITDNTIAHNVSYKGGGIYVEHSEVTIKGNTIEANSADWEGGGIRLEESSGLIEDNIIRDNSVGQSGVQMSSYGGGVALIKSTATVKANTVSGNRNLSLTGLGGGIGINGGSPQVVNNTISSNTAVAGGGIFVFGGATATITGNSIKDNVADRAGTRGAFVGGGMYVAVDSAVNGVSNGSHSPPGGDGANSYSGNKNNVDPLLGDSSVGYNVWWATR